MITKQASVSFPESPRYSDELETPVNQEIDMEEDEDAGTGES